MNGFAGFEDLQDDLTAEVQEVKQSRVAAEVQATVGNARVTVAGAQAAVYEEKCGDCRGTGTFYSYSGRAVGRCFKCNGTGVRKFKTPTEQRERARLQAANRKQREADEAVRKGQQNLDQFADQELLTKLSVLATTAGAFGGDFARSMIEAIRKWGHLTEKQEAAARKLFAPRDSRPADAEVDFTAVEEKFANAAASGLKYPKLRLLGLELSPASASGRNAGSIYVKDDLGLYLGKVTGGRFFKSRDCSDAQLAAITALSGDVLAAAVAYGKETGRCSCCNRELENEESVRLGIGPICRAKWGL